MDHVTDHPHARLLRRLYEAAPDDLFAILQDVIDDTFVLHGAGHGPVGGDFTGLEGVKSHLADFARLSAGTFKLSQHAFYADETWALISQTVTASRNDRSLGMPVAGYWRFSQADKLAEHWEVVADVRAWDGFWS